MFFILSKILDFLLSPLIWILLAFLYGIFFKSRRTLMGTLALLIILSNPFIVNEAFLAWEKEPILLKANKNYEAAIILTGFTGLKSITPGRVYFNKGADRLLHTVELYKSGKIKKIIVSGGTGTLTARKITEADQVKKGLLYCGVPDSVIFIENRSHNTAENARLSHKLIDSLHLKGNILLVTSAFHMRRAEGCFIKAGVQIDPYPVDVYSGDRDFTPDDLLIPSEAALYKWSILIYEITGYAVYRVMGYL